MERTGQPRLTQAQAERIAQDCYADVLAYCRRHAPAGHDAADLAQETFLRFVTHGAYREQGRPIAYLMRVARSVCADAARQHRLETVPLDLDVPDAQGEAQVAETDTDTELAEALAALPDELREAVELRFSADLSVGEVARALGISRFAASRRLRRALRLLGEALGKKDGDTL